MAERLGLQHVSRSSFTHICSPKSVATYFGYCRGEGSDRFFVASAACLHENGSEDMVVTAGGGRCDTHCREDGGQAGGSGGLWGEQSDAAQALEAELQDERQGYRATAYAGKYLQNPDAGDHFLHTCMFILIGCFCRFGYAELLHLL